MHFDMSNGSRTLSCCACDLSSAQQIRPPPKVLASVSPRPPYVHTLTASTTSNTYFTFSEGHVQGFDFLEAVARRISYDNSKIAVSQILGDGQNRRLTRGFCQLESHYLFDRHFCRPARGNEKGVVEGLVNFTRPNFFVPVPQVRDFAELNARLRQRCSEDRQRRLRDVIAVN